MIAEIHKKANENGTDSYDRSEDQLTGDVFGRLRYLPFEKGLKIVLDNAKTLTTEDKKKLSGVLADTSNDYLGEKFEFWPYHDLAELDVQIELDNLLIGVEVKYNSPLSSDDQLERELNVIDRVRCSNKKGVLLFISRSTGLPEAINSINEIREKDSDLLGKIIFAYISWEDIYEAYKLVDQYIYNDYEKLVLNDIQDLLHLKGFDRFKNFNSIEDTHTFKDRYFRFDCNKRQESLRLKKFVKFESFDIAEVTPLSKDRYFEFECKKGMAFYFNFSRTVSKEGHYEFTY